MYLLYSFLLSVAVLIGLPYFLYLVTFKEKYRKNLGQRFGILPDNLKSDERPTIWIHAVSVGETLASQPLIKSLKQNFPGHRIVVSTTTATGQTIARERFGPEFVFLFPLDFGICIRRALRTVNPQMIVLMESELWPRFLHECQRRRIPVIIGNGRMSDRSFRGYQRARWWTDKMLANVNLWLMQSPADAKRILSLGIPDRIVKNVGNLKYDLEIGDQSKRDKIAESVSESFKLDKIKHLIIAGSTTTDEEPIILDAFRNLRKSPGLEQTRLMIVPRHPERFDEVAAMIERSGFTTSRRSQIKATVAVTSSRQNTTVAEPVAEVFLLDTIGELAAVFKLASVVFIGGSLVPKGGHNILEPAASAKPVVVGPHMENFRQVMIDFTTRNAVIQLPDLKGPALTAALTDTLVELLLNDAVGKLIGKKAQAVIIENRGAANRCTEEIITLLKEVDIRKSDNQFV